MKRVVTGLCVVVLLCGVAYGQSTPGSNYEHLKCFDQLIGNWIYDGPLLEDIPGIGEKGTKAVTHISFAWILNKNAVEAMWSIEPVAGTKIAGKGLLGWDVAGQRIIGGGMNSAGGHDLSTMTYDPATKTLTSKEEGTDGEGKANTSTNLMTLSDPDTLVFQITERTGGSVQGDSPKLILKRVALPKRPTAVQQSVPADPSEPVKKAESDAKSESAKPAETVK